MDLNKITQNPAFGITNKEDRPNWLCAHQDAKVVDYINKRFICVKCSPKTGFVRKVSQTQILSNISSNRKENC
jgi:hypothetical protein